LLSCTLGLQAQEVAETTTYYQVTKLNDPNGKLMDVERQIMMPYFQERVNGGEMVWHGMYHVKYPRSEHKGFEYVAVAIFNDFAHLDSDNADKMLQAALPDASTAKMWERVRTESDIYSSEVFVGVDGLPSAANGPSKFIQVNYMDVVPGKAADYVKMESDLWKPVHAAQAKKGVLNDWLLVERIMPSGSDFGPGFITVDGFTDWVQIQKNGKEMFASAQSVYPDEDLHKKLGSIEELRTLTRTETWELVTATTPPVEEKIVTKVLEEGTGPHPMKGQQVAYNVEATDMEGKLLFGNQNMVGIPIQMVMGSNPYDPYTSKMLAQLGTGGKLEAIFPVAHQDENMRGLSDNKDMKMSLHLLEVGTPAADGARKLREIIDGKGLAAAKAWHARAKSEMSGKYAFQEWTMNVLGYELMEDGHNQAALFVLAENQRANPESFNAHDSLADAYRAAGNHAMAAKHYGRAVKMNPNAKISKQKLEALKR
ncbi:MAG: tetratricopeptide repeat protein, partial [Bacteroidota bacterium]